jgi:hypothetical protein
MNFRKRLEELERKVTSESIELTMPDGRKEVLRGYTDDGIRDLFRRAMREMNAGANSHPTLL